jgi:CHAT domain-containing protein/SIR2-like protein
MSQTARPPAILDVRVRSNATEGYQVELGFFDPESDADNLPVTADAPIDVVALRGLQYKPTEYGRALSTSVFTGDVLKLFRVAKAITESRDSSLRIRLTISEGADILQDLRWELLQDPDDDTQQLATSENLLFSRYMLRRDYRPVRRQPRQELKALVAVSAPDYPDKNYPDLERVPRQGEIDRATAALKGIEVKVAEAPLTLDRLVAKLQEGVDILYLVCHGALREPDKEDARLEPELCLQTDTGAVEWVPGQELCTRIRDNPPKLVVLATCQSAGTGAGPTPGEETSTAQASIAPMLAEAGVPAVIAMQGYIDMETVKKAMPVFFEELLKDGSIDRAMAVARRAVQDEEDFWMPALFLRLKDGRIWYEGFGRSKNSRVKWDGIVAEFAPHKLVTPIVGWGLGERLYGSLRNIAQHVASERHFPLAPHQRTDLPFVSQYLRVNQSSRTAAINAFKEQMRAEVLGRLHNELPAGSDELKLSALLQEASRIQHGQPDDPFRILAELPVPVYVNASPDDLLFNALKRAKKRPRKLWSYWHDRRQAAPRRNERPEEPGVAVGSPHDAVLNSNGMNDEWEEPRVNDPLIYHIFGHLSDEKSLVITADDYFDFLIRSGSLEAWVPSVVNHHLTTTTLMYLGFQITDWSFRVLYRLMGNAEGAYARRGRPHTAVQVEADVAQFLDLAKAQEYLEAYYAGSHEEYVEESHFDIFWGSGEEFLRELMPKWRESQKRGQQDADY